MSSIRILAAAPVCDAMEYCFMEFVQNLKLLDTKCDIIIVDNSRSKKFFRKIRKIKGITVIYDDATSQINKMRLVSSRNKILDYAIKGDYDYLLMLDSDVMVREDAIERLLSHNKDVVSGLVYNIFRSSGVQKMLPVCFMPIRQDILDKMRQTGKATHEQTANDFRRHLTESEAKSGHLLEVKYPSAGILLLSRKALLSGARYDAWQLPGGKLSGDEFPFFEGLKGKGFKLYCDTSLVCRHDVLPKYRNGQVHPLYRD